MDGRPSLGGRMFEERLLAKRKTECFSTATQGACHVLPLIAGSQALLLIEILEETKRAHL